MSPTSRRSAPPCSRRSEEYEVRAGELPAQAIREQYAAWKAVAADGGAAMSDSPSHALHELQLPARRVGRNDEADLRDEPLRRELGERLHHGSPRDGLSVHEHAAQRRHPADATARPSSACCSTATCGRTPRPSPTRPRLTPSVTTVSTPRRPPSSTATISRRPARWSHVSANNQPVSADTGIRLPIIRGIANGIAMQEVQKRMPQSNAITRQKITAQVVPKLDSEVATNLDKAETQLEAKLYGPLRELESYPQELDVNSTDDAILVRARLMEEIELGGNEWPNLPMPSNGIVLQTHESLLNNSIERANFAGREMTQQQLNDELKARMEKLLGRPLEQQVEDDRRRSLSRPKANEPTKADEPTQGRRNSAAGREGQDGRVRLRQARRHQVQGQRTAS